MSLGWEWVCGCKSWEWAWPSTGGVPTVVPPSFKGRGVGEYQVFLLLFVIVVFMGIVVIIHHSSWCLFRSRGGGIISTIVFNLIVVVVQGEGAMHVNTGIISTIVFNLIVVVLLLWLLLSFLWALLSSFIIQCMLTRALFLRSSSISFS